MTELWLVRHGLTDWNLEGRYQGQSDAPLNETGMAQARQLAEKLAGVRFEALYSSDLQRARQTADILANHLGLKVRLDHRLREICQGEWEGQLVGDIMSRYAAEVEKRRADPYGARPPGGESVSEVAARVWAAVDDICQRHPAGKVLVVSHGLALATFIARAKGAPLAQVYSLIPENAEAKIVEWQSDC